MSKPYPPVDYHDYLQLDQILSSQNLKSHEYKQPAHDEMLFIVVHQAYELWFKQIINELNSILDLFVQPTIDDKDMGLIVARLSRITEIQKLLIDQIRVLETMTPLDFLEFRDMLYPASGFQSFQFRLIENKLGLSSSHRLRYNQSSYERSLTKEQAEQIEKMQKEKSLFDLVDSWLTRTPFLSIKGFDFWKSYHDAVIEMFKEDRQVIENHEALGVDDKQRNLAIQDRSQKLFESLFDEEVYKKAKEQGQWRLSYKAIHAALFIQLYRDQPVLQIPFRLLTSLLDIDELMTTWRYRHALMAKRMLGAKIGTGGSSGYDYLRQTSDRHRIFDDLFQLTTFFIPRSRLPELPTEIQKELGFYYFSQKN